MADAVMKHQLKELNIHSKHVVDSAGTGGWHQGETPHEGTRDVLKRHAVSDQGIFARQIVKEDFEKFDYIFAMDKANLKDIEQFARKNNIIPKHLELFMASVTDPTYQKEVPDPYYTGEFDLVFDMVNEGCIGILKEYKLIPS